jgi:hypothetical protein
VVDGPFQAAKVPADTGRIRESSGQIGQIGEQSGADTGGVKAAGAGQGDTIFHPGHLERGGLRSRDGFRHQPFDPVGVEWQKRGRPSVQVKPQACSTGKAERDPAQPWGMGVDGVGFERDQGFSAFGNQEFNCPAELGGSH